MKRILALILCLMLSGAAALAETYAVNYNNEEYWVGYGMLLRDDGTPLTPPKTYQSITKITPKDTPEAERLYAAMPCDMGIPYDPDTADDLLYGTDYACMALMDAQGQLLTGADYISLECINGYVLFAVADEETLYGAMDSAGNVIIPAEYLALKPLMEDRWLAMPFKEAELVSDDPSDEYEGDFYNYFCPIQIIGADGSARDTGLHSIDRYFEVNDEGICMLWNVDEYDGQSVFIDQNGELLFDRGFESAENFVGDYAVVRVETGAGVIDKSGSFVIPPEFDYIFHDQGMGFIANAGTRVAVFAETDAKPVFDMTFSEAEDVYLDALSDELFLVQVDGRQVLYGPYGALKMEVPEDMAIQSYGLPQNGAERLILQHGIWPDSWVQLTDYEGNPLGDIYRSISFVADRDDQARCIVSDYPVYIDSEGEAQAEWDYESYGLIDQDGAVLLPTVYKELEMLSFDRYWVRRGDLRGMIDEKGNWYYSISDYEELMD